MRRAFTLIELLIVVAVIAILSSMVLTVTSMVRDAARALDTKHRMQAVLDGLAQYDGGSEGACAALQTRLDLGGVAKFATIKVIDQIVRAGGAGRVDPKLLAKPDSSGVFWSTGGDESFQQQPYWDRVFDAQPSDSGSVAAGWYPTTWPYQWPDSDWDLAAPGTTPPILRYPWGRPGLRLDGTPCDPTAPPTAVSAKVWEYTEINAWQNSVTWDGRAHQVAVANRWVTSGAAASGGPISFTVAGSTETLPVDAAVVGQRSGPSGATVSATANQAQPYDLGYLSPLRTLALLEASGLLSPDDEPKFRSDRRSRQPWNDAWGNPLVVVYALFQPERFHRAWDAENRRDLLLHGAQKAYGYTRSLYLAVGAIGPTIRDRGTLAALAASSDRAGDAAPLRELWLQVRDTDRANEWTEASFDDPAWKDVRDRRQGGERCFLTAPIELH
jgi:prepilin-type N-terminal cleavage/methylation domain-containing protein